MRKSWICTPEIYPFHPALLELLGFFFLFARQFSSLKCVIMMIERIGKRWLPGNRSPWRAGEDISKRAQIRGHLRNKLKGIWKIMSIIFQITSPCGGRKGGKEQGREGEGQRGRGHPSLGLLLPEGSCSDLYTPALTLHLQLPPKSFKVFANFSFS